MLVLRTIRTELEGLSLQNGVDLDPDRAHDVCTRFLDALEAGAVRAAGRGADGSWTAHSWVKEGILTTFGIGDVASFGGESLSFVDRRILNPRRFDPSDRVRIVPGGTAIRRGAYLGPGVVCMPPSYVNVGAYVGSDSMVDSHVLVGSCAQIGARVHLSAAVQIGGVLEPTGAMPVIVEDDAFIGGGCGVYEGCIVRERAVLAPGVILSRSTPILDLVLGRTLHGEVPADAVVVPGSRRPSTVPEGFEGVSIYAAVIVKYRDERTDAATALEESLRLHGSAS